MFGAITRDHVDIDWFAWADDAATLTDGLDTAIFVLGVEKGLELIEHYPEYETIIVDSAGKVSFSKGLVAPN